ncbi:MAG: polymer-forming cytoskeletal protein [Saprospiraceae bacterium]|jgi:cytoskeletal protein CcmA (bactofilin family)|nr:polymer-forming cytoskeletal protein [Saprospiraceae bacterium]
MFGSNKKPDNSNISANSSALNSLVQGTIVEGTVRAESDIRVDGIIHGDLTCSAKVIIGPTGEIKGEVKCVNAMIDGKFEGKLYVEDLLTVRETAIVNGDIHTGKLIVQSGAVFNVTCDMGKSNSRKTLQKDPSQRIEQMLKPANVG